MDHLPTWPGWQGFWKGQVIYLPGWGGTGQGGPPTYLAGGREGATSSPLRTNTCENITFSRTTYVVGNNPT